MNNMKQQIRKPNNEDKKQFEQADEKFNKIHKKDVEQAKRPSNIKLNPKTFMTISDVDVEDASWFKEFCDKNYRGKQFLAIKVIRQVMERIDPLVINLTTQINELKQRMKGYEEILNQIIQEPEQEGPNIPQTQGANKKKQTDGDNK